MNQLAQSRHIDEICQGSITNSDTHLATWNAYQRAWGPIDADERRSLLDGAVADAIAYTDPVTELHGVDALIARIEATQAQFAGATFRNDRFLEHHDQGLFHWTMLKADGGVFVTGSSFARFGEDGRLVQATGFFGSPQG